VRPFQMPSMHCGGIVMKKLCILTILLSVNLVFALPPVNDLLKSLEEPPAHVYFLLVTDQAERVLPTIASRCQTIEFRPVADEVVAMASSPRRAAEPAFEPLSLRQMYARLADQLAGAVDSLRLTVEAPVDLYVDGYFQNSRHVRPVIDTLRGMFRRQFHENGMQELLRSRAGLSGSQLMLAIHLRRGDYLDPAVRRVHGLPATQSVLSCLEELKPKPGVALVFSDSQADIHLPCRTINLTGPRSSLAQDIEQFRLMSCCDAIIASNSTFSYWAGLLSGSVRQLLIPSPWMHSDSVRTSALLTDGVRAYPTQLL